MLLVLLCGQDGWWDHSESVCNDLTLAGFSYQVCGRQFCLWYTGISPGWPIQVKTEWWLSWWWFSSGRPIYINLWKTAVLVMTGRPVHMWKMALLVLIYFWQAYSHQVCGRYSKIPILRPPLRLSKSGLKDHFWTVPKVVSWS